MPVNDVPTMVYEPPLARPKAASVSLAFDQCTTVFAVDTSGSTAGLILKEEKNAIAAVIEHFPSATKHRSSIAPWHMRSEELLDVTSLESLEAGGGTDPAALFQNAETRKALQHADLWFLLTDGEIHRDDVETFAEQIVTHGLHGKGCVLIVFGYCPPVPVMCNISVVYVFQAKGCFLSLCGKSKQEIVLNSETKWSDLPTIAYHQLFDVRIPPAQDIQKDSIILHDRTQINLDDLCNGTLGEEQTNKLLGNDGDLKSMLLAMSTRGRNAQAKDWISQQRVGLVGLSTASRTDQDGAAAASLEKIIVALSKQSLPEFITELKRDLRQAHSRNWKILSESKDSAEPQATEKNAVLDDAVARLSLYDKSKASSPSVLSPVSPGIRKLRDGGQPMSSNRHAVPLPHSSSDMKPAASGTEKKPVDEESDSSDGEGIFSRFLLRESHENSGSSDSEHDDPEIGPGGSDNEQHILEEIPSINYSLQQKKRLKVLQQYLGQDEKVYLPSPPSQATTPSDIACLMQEITFIPGFKLIKRGRKASTLECPICGDVTQHPALLLKKPPSGEITLGFPLPMSCSEIAFPLALSSFRETDVVAQSTCCSTCAYYVPKNGKSLYDEEIVAAIPVTPALFLDENQQSWLNIVDNLFEKRFARCNLLPIMLGIFTDAHDRAAQDQSAAGIRLENVLAQACEQVRPACKVAYASGRLGTLNEAASFYLCQNPLDFHNELFSHPLDSFALLIQGSNTKSPRAVTSAIFMRTILHILGQYMDNISSPHGASSSEYLQKLKEERTMTMAFDHDSQFRRKPITIELLSRCGLLDTAAIQHLEALKPSWSELQRDAEPAFYVCLLKLAYGKRTSMDARDLLESWRTLGELDEVFANPCSIHEGMINRILIASP